MNDETCPDCKAVQVRSIVTRAGVSVMFKCMTIRTGGRLDPHRSFQCYDRQLAQQAELLRRAREVVREVAAGRVIVNYFQNKAQALVPDLEAALVEGRVVEWREAE